VGEWKRSKPNGYGIYVSNPDPSTGTKYEGNWKNGMKDGPGAEQFWGTGDVYVGNFKEGWSNGDGKYIWKSGAIYEGQFKDGEKSGYGKW
jgi:hypothetical protein